MIYVEYDELKEKIIDNIKELIVKNSKNVGDKTKIGDDTLEEFLTFLQKNAPTRLFQCSFLLAVINHCDNSVQSIEELGLEKKTILNAAALYISSQIEKSYRKGIYGLASNWGIFKTAESSLLRTLLLDSLNLTEENSSPSIEDKIALYEALEHFLLKYIRLKDQSTPSDVSAFWKIKERYPEYDPLKELQRVSHYLQKEKVNLLEDTKASMNTLI